MATEVKKPLKNVCACGHPHNKKEAQAFHKAANEQRLRRFEAECQRDKAQRLEDRLSHLEALAHKHWWQS